MGYEIEQGRKLVIQAGLELCRTGLVARTWGNISAKVSDKQYIITPSGRDYKSLKETDLVLVNQQDGSYVGNIKPSGEKGIHSIAYQLREQAAFVIHTHQSYASAFSIFGKNIPVKENQDILGRVIPCASYGMYGSKKLIDGVKKALSENKTARVVLLRNHGALCIGESYEEAFSLAYALEDECKKRMQLLCGGKLPEKNEKKKQVPVDLCNKIEERYGCQGVLFSTEPYTMAMSCLQKTLVPYLDDLAQIAGTSIKCFPSLEKEEKLLKEFKDKNAVLIKNQGAICTGKNQEEAEATIQVLEKACIAAYLAIHTKEGSPISTYYAKKDREGYINSYSKLK